MHLLPKSEDTMKPIINYVQDVDRINCQKNFVIFGRTQFTTRRTKGCQSGSKGCKDRQLIPKTILEDCRKRIKNLNVAWIDYGKTFNSVPHSWTEKSTELTKVINKTVKFCKVSMVERSTQLQLKPNKGLKHSRCIMINRGTFQGDSQSKPLFCIAVILLTQELNGSKYGYQV